MAVFRVPKEFSDLSSTQQINFVSFENPVLLAVVLIEIHHWTFWGLCMHDTPSSLQNLVRLRGRGEEENNIVCIRVNTECLFYSRFG